MIDYYGYPACGTCKKAKKWLTEHNVSFAEHHIVEEAPSKEQIKQLHTQSGLPLKKFFNTSGVKYRELGLKDKLPNLTEDEQYELLASDGKLLKRPIVSDGKKVSVGFQEAQFEELWKS